MSENTSEDAGQRFLIDLMLMRLGRWLRLLGQDVANPEGGRDEDILRQAEREGRIIITRDKRLFMDCTRGYVPCLLIRSSKISDQLLEMAEAGLPLQLDPRRCTLCNGTLQGTETAGMMRWQCSACKKLYWEGGHWDKMESMLQEIRSRNKRESRGLRCSYQ